MEHAFSLKTTKYLLSIRVFIDEKYSFTSTVRFVTCYERNLETTLNSLLFMPRMVMSDGTPLYPI